MDPFSLFCQYGSTAFITLRRIEEEEGRRLNLERGSWAGTSSTLLLRSISQLLHRITGAQGIPRISRSCERSWERNWEHRDGNRGGSSQFAREVRVNSLALPSYKTLGFCWIVYGILRLVMAVILAVYSGTATVMFGALLVRVPDPFSLMTLFHVVYLCMIILSGIAGVLGILAGLSLMGGAGSGAGRTLAIVAAILSVSELPIGTTLGIYTLVVLLPSPRSAN
jgi:hypothetical protein